MKYNYRFIILLNLLSILGTIGLSQVKIESQVMSNGSVALSNDVNRLYGTVGQSTIGRNSNQTYAIKIGFWEQSNGQITNLEISNNGLFPTEFYLYQNYPNPFNPVTTIKYSIPPNAKHEMLNVHLKVYDVLGNEVTTLVYEYKDAGSYEVEFNASRLSSGVYFYTMQSGEFVQTKKLIFMK